MHEPMMLIAVSAVFLLAGVVKGVIGFGLPTIVLALLTVIIDLHSAIALVLVPSLATNIWQAFAGGHGKLLWKRLWPFLCTAAITIQVGAAVLTRVAPPALSALLGGLLVTYALFSLSGVRPVLSKQQEQWFGPLSGCLNGIFTGMTGSFILPGIPYLNALRLPRDQLVQAMGILFMLSTCFLAMALGDNDLLSPQQGLLSFMGLLPASCGMVLGQRIRRRLAGNLFRVLFFLSLLLLGIYLVVRNILFF